MVDHEAEQTKWDAVWQEGEQAAKDGLPPTACPYPDYGAAKKREHWIRGWQNGARAPKKQ
jgi:ribosome modulation factor